MGLELFIEDQKVALPPGLVIAVSYSANLIAEIIQPVGSASNQFQLPKTQQLQEILEGADSINSATELPYKKLSARLIQNGRELIQNGFAVIEEASQVYEVVVYGGNLDFFERIVGKKLRDLDMSDLDHVWDFQTVANSRANLDGFIYPIIDWSDDQAFIDNLTDEIDTRTMYHAIYSHTLVSRIFSEVLFNKSGDIFDTDNYKNLIVPIVDSIQSDSLKSDREVLTELAGGLTKTDQLLVGNSTSDAVTFVPMSIPASLKNTYFFLQFRTFFVSGVGNISATAYKAPVTGKYKVNFSGKHRQTEDDVIFLSIFQMWRVRPNGSRVVVFSQVITIIEVFFSSFPGQNFIESTFTMEEGDIMVPMVVSGGSKPFSAEAYVFLTDVQWSIIPLTAKNIYNTKISAGDNMPDMTQVDFLKSIAKIFGIIFQTNSFTKTVEFRQFKDIYANIPIARDWTDKLDLNNTNRQSSISFHPNGYGQKNILKWSNEVSQTLPEELGEGSILVSDETLPGEKTLIQIPFSATEMDKRLVDLDVPVIRFLKLGRPATSVKPRMLIIRKEVNDVTVTYQDTVSLGQAGNDIPLCYFQLPDQDFNLGFDDSLIDDNYKEFNLFLDKYKSLEAFYNLDENDIAELDFFIPIYDDHFKHYFFISKIDRFVAGKSTKVELIRL